MNKIFEGENPEKVLKKVFGYDNFRPMQREVIESVLSGQDTIAILPTGGGKSLCFQIVALIFSGVTLVVTPLIALMQDQVSALKRIGVGAVCLNSAQSWSDYTKAQKNILNGDAKIVYVSPEGLSSVRLRELFSQIKVSCIVVDEAHCISQWGYDFRPDYLEIASARQIFFDAVCLAMTATATKSVRADIAKNLRMKNPRTLISSFNRPNIFLEVKIRKNLIEQILSCAKNYEGGAGIIYCFSKKEADNLTQELLRKGCNALNYHAGLSAQKRSENQEKFLRDEVQIMVATIAFGMGINKSNVRFVIHTSLPKSLEQYYQEIGRAGRDGKTATALLLYSNADATKIRYLLSHADSGTEDFKIFSAMFDYARKIDCRRKMILQYFGETLKNPQKRCCDFCEKFSSEVENEKSKIDITIPAQKFMSCVIRTGMRFGSTYVISVLRGSNEKKIAENGHQKISTWGIGRDLSKCEWKNVCEVLLKCGLILKTKNFSVLKMTDLGIAALKNREQIFAEKNAL